MMRRILFLACLIQALPWALSVAAQPVPEPPAAERLVPGGRSGWVTDGKGSCWLWAGGLEAGSTNISGQWSGQCPNGPAEGNGRSVIGWQVAGQRREMVWEGPLHNGKAEGEGTLTVSEEGVIVSREQGRYHEDRLVQGRLELPRQGLVYEGGWSLGHPNGEGELRIGGEVIRGKWENGCLKRKNAWISFTRSPSQCEGEST